LLFLQRRILKNLTGGFTMQFSKIFCGVLLLLGLMACEDMKGRDIGTLAGAGIGAAAGSQIGGTGTVNAIGAAGGAVVGGDVGHEVGKSMEEK
jgi:osmotically inducible lipoprotein OsmB